jgi:nicotinate phosphoribosyltransferase
MLDFAGRAHNHNYRLDPIIRSLLDTDFYKLLMLGFIHRWFPAVPVTFSLINRTSAVRLARIVAEDELRAQLDHARSLSFTNSELIWLQGNTFYGTKGIFTPEVITCLAGFRLPDYELTSRDGQYELRFSGSWVEVTLWEIYALSILSELRTRAGLRSMGKFELDVFYARGKSRAWDKIERLKAAQLQGSIADFGTRRRHSFLWQEWIVQAMAGELGGVFSGTSNAFLAMKHDMEAIGTNAHELPMVLAALAEAEDGSDDALRDAQYRVLDLWRQTYGGNLLVALPDTFGSTQFLKGAPDWVADWGIRFDSKEPTAAAEEAIAFWMARGRDPAQKLGLFSDGLDVDEIIALDREFAGRMRVGFGWGTLSTNDFRNCHPRGGRDFEPISLVCKVTGAAGRPAVKLSDNYAKATGPAEAVERYRRVFGTEGVANVPALV